MRLPFAAIAALVLAACQPAIPPAEEPAGPTPAEQGQDDPNVPFTPGPVDPPVTYEPYSTTAMSFTPGTLTITPTPQTAPNMAAGAVFAFGNGYTLETTLIPGGAAMGQTPFDFDPFYGAYGDAGLDDIKVYAVDRETVPATGAPNGGFCNKTGFIATKVVNSADNEDLLLIAFSGETWPPASETAVCGTFNYTRES